MIENVLVYLVLGAFSGLAAGMLGVGGGLIIVPVLAHVFQRLGFEQSMVMHMAVGTSLVTIVFTSLSSVYAHHQKGAVLWATFLRLTPGIVAGALLGALVASYLQTTVLRIFFGVFELLVAIQLLLNIKPKSHWQIPGRLGLTAAGGVIGTVSAVLGIGGGTLTVPFLIWCNVNIKNAVATAAAGGLPIAVAGSLGFIVFAWGREGLPEHSAGYVYYPAVIGIVAASVLFAPLGARLAHRMPADWLRIIFSLLLFGLAFKMILG